jgi:cysteine protease ATG4
VILAGDALIEGRLVVFFFCLVFYDLFCVCSRNSGQMLLARALVVLKLGTEWSTSDASVQETLFEILQNFADLPSAAFSIHALTVAATRLSDKKLGEWLGPASVSVCLRAVVNAKQPWGLRCVVASDGGVIYRDLLPRNGPVLILVPLRLGLEALNPTYIPLLQGVLQCSLCVGIIGGRESSSFYFLGWSGNDVKVFLKECLF